MGITQKRLIVINNMPENTFQATCFNQNFISEDHGPITAIILEGKEKVHFCSRKCANDYILKKISDCSDHCFETSFLVLNFED